MRRALLFAAVLALAGPAFAPGAAAQQFAIDFTWAGTGKCSDRSPAIGLSNVPAGTASLDVQMVDLDVPGFKHGGGKVAYAGGSEIPAGAVRYVGPCPPSGRHSYRFRVTALDASGKALGTAEQTREFPPR
ncbi:MAG: phospholipid-binding protein [Alphaproteobacteria bacterium]|nr:phospholipid-binding protein [Alphaproteobacteria bacterium]